jgi:Flp pilus assembly protein CpaB
MSRRTIALVAAVALAALATIALISYIRGLEDRVYTGVETVKVFVAKQDIPAGTSGDTASQQAIIESRTVPAKVRPTGAITSLEQISGRFAAVQIFKDEIIVGQRFVAPGASATHVLPIGPGKQAVSVAISGAPAVASFVQPGDKVSLIVQTTSNLVRGNARGGPFVKYVMQGLDVIAVGSRVISTGTSATAQQNANQQQSNAAIFTFAVTPQQAEQLVFATLNTTLYFTLLPENSPTARTNGRTFANLFS